VPLSTAIQAILFYNIKEASNTMIGTHIDMHILIPLQNILLIILA
jgi:hypothetical protein